jgi:hypothetical protein
MPHIGHVSNVRSNDLIRRWREQRREILKTLAPEMLKEYRRLSGLIRAVLAEEAQFARRASLADHKKKLIAFFTEHGPAHRGEIVNKTGIPLGSLGALLRESEFESHERGLWALKGQVKKPGHVSPTPR